MRQDLVVCLSVSHTQATPLVSETMWNGEMYVHAEQTDLNIAPIKELILFIHVYIYSKLGYSQNNWGFYQ